MELTLTRDNIAAAIMCAASKDVRYYLKCVCVQVLEDKTVRVMSTNGHIAFEAQETNLADCGPMEILIPIDAAKAIAKAKSHIVTLAKHSQSWTCAGQIFDAVEGKFPDLARVIPARNSSWDSNVQHYNCDLLATIQGAMRKATGLSKAIFHIQHSQGEKGTGLMHMRSQSFPRAVIMSVMLHELG